VAITTVVYMHVRGYLGRSVDTGFEAVTRAAGRGVVDVVPVGRKRWFNRPENWYRE
jgi:hypothetical protein